MDRVELTVAQEQAAGALWGRVIAIAGPGTGKTRTAISRIGNLIAAGVEPPSIIAITFTTRAAHELQERLDPVQIGFVGTIHAFARYILVLMGVDSGLGPEFDVWDEVDRHDVLADIVREQNVGRLISAKIVDYSLARLHCEGLSETAIPPWMEGAAGHTPRAHHINRVILAYRARKLEANAEDFDGLIDRARRQLAARPMTLMYLRERWRHYTVDEVQDNNPAQDMLIGLLRPELETTPTRDSSAFRIGDPLQSLYRWRGAEPELVAVHEQSAHVRIVLPDNFRSDRRIVAAVNAVARRDPAWPGVPQVAHSEAPGAIDVIDFDDELEELDWIAQSIAESCNDLRELAVLSRRNKEVERLKRILDRLGVPCRLVGEQRSWIKSGAIRALIAYLRLARNPDDDLPFRKAWAAFCSPGFEDLAALEKLADGGPLFKALHSQVGYALDAQSERFVDLVYQAYAARRSAIDWWPPVEAACMWLENDAVSSGLTTREEILRKVRGMIREYVDNPPTRGGRSLGRLIWWLLFEQGPDEIDPDEDVVTLSTIHMAKGLEWPRVYVPACVENVLPSSQSVESELKGNEQAIVDERRCFYVAVSRAREDLVLTWHRTDVRRNECLRSRFLDEMT